MARNLGKIIKISLLILQLQGKGSLGHQLNDSWNPAKCDAGNNANLLGGATFMNSKYWFASEIQNRHTFTLTIHTLRLKICS